MTTTTHMTRNLLLESHLIQDRPKHEKKKWFRDGIQQLVQADAETHSQTLGGVKQT